MLQARLEGPRVAAIANPNPAVALNEIVISKATWGRMVHLRVHIDSAPVTDLFADSVLVATPTGSTGYNFSAGGPVLEPGLEAILVNATCAHRMNFSPLVLNARSEITVEFHDRKPREEACLLVDGQAWCAVSHEERLKISQAPMYLPLIVFEENFYRKLRDKLAWGGLS